MKRCSTGRLPRQPQAHNGARFRRICGLQGPAEQLRQAPGYGEPQSGAGGLRREKGLKPSLQGRLREAGAVVADFDHDRFSGRAGDDGDRRPACPAA